jgi:hypothetical protein
MPTGEVPQRYRDILGSKALGHLATIGADGRPQVNPVWFLSDGQNVYLSVKPETVKYRNLRANPRRRHVDQRSSAPRPLPRNPGRGHRLRTVCDPRLGQLTGAHIHGPGLHRGHGR